MKIEAVNRSRFQAYVNKSAWYRVCARSTRSFNISLREIDGQKPHSQPSSCFDFIFSLFFRFWAVRYIKLVIPSAF